MDGATILAIKLIAIVFSIVSIIGNALVCHVIVRLKTMKTSINYIILNLAILDAISGFLSINAAFVSDRKETLGKPVLEMALNTSDVLPEVLCRIKWLYWLGPNTSPILFMAMAYERYKAIVHPFSRLQNKATKTRLKLLVILAWLSGLGYLVIDLIKIEYNAKIGTCFPKDGSWYNGKLAFGIYFVSQYLIPSIMLFAFYLRVIRTLRQQDNTLGLQAEAERARRKARKKVMWIIIAVTVVFYVCCGIPQILVTCFSFVNLLNTNNFVADVLVMTFAINSAFNPFIYFAFIQSFRNGFKTVFLTKKHNSVANVSLSGGNKNSFSLHKIEAGEKNERSHLPTLLAFVNAAEQETNIV